ncbi:MAG: hypothetical protein IKP97_04745 [Kiritimatiellae bacterium]|nr:hypothetical protein [Kiritimatiellia bacterium]
MKKCILMVAMLAGMAGCNSVRVYEKERAQLDRLHEQGVSWAGNPPPGYKPAVKMTPAIFWSILPGAGQMFIANKMGDAAIENHDYDRAELNGSGVLLLSVSWFPYIYSVTMPFGMAGAIMDVNRANNLKLVQEYGYLAEEMEANDPMRQNLQELKLAYEEGLLNKEEYEQKKSAIIKEL